MRSPDAVSQEKTGVGGLVVGDVLPGDAEAVDGVVHQGDEAMGGGDRGGEQAQLLAVAGGGEEFFAPVAEQVGAEAGV